MSLEPPGTPGRVESRAVGATTWTVVVETAALVVDVERTVVVVAMVEVVGSIGWIVISVGVGCVEAASSLAHPAIATTPTAATNRTRTIRSTLDPPPTPTAGSNPHPCTFPPAVPRPGLALQPRAAIRTRAHFRPRFGLRGASTVRQ